MGAVGGIGQSQSTSKQITVSPTGASQVAFKAPIVNPGGINLGNNASLNLGGISLDKLKKFKGDLNFITESSSDPQLISALASLANSGSSPSGSVTPSATGTPGATPDDPNAPLGSRISAMVNNGLQSLRDFIFKTGTDGGKTVNTNVWWLLAVVLVLWFAWRKVRR